VHDNQVTSPSNDDAPVDEAPSSVGSLDDIGQQNPETQEQKSNPETQPKEASTTAEQPPAPTELAATPDSYY
jgi:hypothetical protein